MEILERAFKTIPGLTTVFAVLALFMLPPDSELAAAIRVFIVAWLLYRISSALDWFFDRLYAPQPERKRKLWKSLSDWWYSIRIWRLPAYAGIEEKREAVRIKLGLKTKIGLYKEAKAVAMTAGKWESDIYPFIGRSKFARAFIAPLLLIAFFLPLRGRLFSTKIEALGTRLIQWRLLADFREDIVRASEKLQFLSRWEIPMLLGLLCAFLFVYLRIEHMKKLYKFAAAWPKPASARKRWRGRSIPQRKSLF